MWLKIEEYNDFHTFLNLLPHRLNSKLVQNNKAKDKIRKLQLRDKPHLKLPNFLDVSIPNARILYFSFSHARSLLQDAR